MKSQRVLASDFWIQRNHSSCNTPYYAHAGTLRMLCSSDLGRHTMQSRGHLHAPILASEELLPLGTDGLYLTLSAAAVSPANAISCSSAWGERHPSVANSIWRRHIKVSSPSFLTSCLLPSIRCLLHRTKCVSVCVCLEAVGIEILCSLVDLFYVISRCWSNLFII